MRAACGFVSGAMLAGLCVLDAAKAEQPDVAELLRRIDALQNRVDELEARARKPTSAPRRASNKAAAPPARAGAPSAPPVAQSAAAAGSAASSAQLTPAPIAGLAPPEPMGEPFEDALRSDLPGMSFRIPGAQTELRLYGFAKLLGYHDFDGRNQTDAPSPSAIPLWGGAASRQGGDFAMSARFSRLGLDTRTLTDWGTLETRVEGDFAGNAATSGVAAFRLRQAWAELGTEQFRALIGQANSLWNEGVFETLNDATNLNQSFVRQAQIRATGQLAPGLTGQVSLEAPDTQFTSAAGVFTPGSTPLGGLSPAFNTMPDLLGRLTYRSDGLELDLRGLARRLTMRTAGTPLEPPATSVDAFGWGLAGQVRFPMRWLSEAFGPDHLIGMGYYGRGVGRYFGGNTSGQDALSTIGLPDGNGSASLASASLDPLPTYGATLAYRRFWTDQLRSNFAFSYAWQDYPDYALAFVPGSFAATSLNRDMRQAIVNLIWSPFGRIRDGVVETGWLDVGLEFTNTRRDVFGGDYAATGAGAGFGVANRIIGAAIGRF